MILLTLVALTAAIASTSASAQGPVYSRWGWDAEACIIQPGEGDGVPLVIEGNELTYYESACTITNWTPIGTAEAAWQVTMQCAGEGETWEKESILAIDRGDYGVPVQLIEIDAVHGNVETRTYCGE